MKMDRLDVKCTHFPNEPHVNIVTGNINQLRTSDFYLFFQWA